MLFKEGIITRKSIIDKFNWQIENLGMFTCHRKISDDKIVVPFGASEILMYALKRNEIDCAVVVCEGAGTVITSNASLLQAIGAYMNGVFYTTLINEVVQKINQAGGYLLSKKKAVLNQYKGVKKALELGFKKVAVTVRGDETSILKKIAGINLENDEKIFILSVCNSGITKRQAQMVASHADLAWACGSKYIREIVGPRAVAQLGMKIPVFALSQKGIDLIASYSDKDSFKLKIDSKDKKHYITSNKYEKGGIKATMGKFNVYLYETKKLPVITEDEPEPLI
jgi:putative methanogenesis marker protein 8